MPEVYLNEPGVRHLWKSTKSYVAVEIAKALAGAGMTIKILDELPEKGEEMVLYFIKRASSNIFADFYAIDFGGEGSADIKFRIAGTGSTNIDITSTTTIEWVIEQLEDSVFGNVDYEFTWDSEKGEILAEKEGQPATLEITQNDTPLVKKSSGGGSNNIYEEYVWVNGQFELIGSTQIDLSDYWSKTDLVAITDEELDAIFAEGDE